MDEKNIATCANCGRLLGSCGTHYSHHRGAGLYEDEFFCRCGWVTRIRPVIVLSRAAETDFEMASCRNSGIF